MCVCVYPCTYIHMDKVIITIRLSNIVINIVLLFLAPIDKMKEVLRRTVSEAKAAISKVSNYQCVKDTCIVNYHSYIV